MKDESATEKAVGCLMVFAFLPFLCALQGWALATLWGWFVAPKFGLPSLTIWEAYGICATVNIFKTMDSTSTSKKKIDSIDVLGQQFGYAVGYLFIVGIGWLVYRWGMGR